MRGSEAIRQIREAEGFPVPEESAGSTPGDPEGDKGTLKEIQKASAAKEEKTGDGKEAAEGNEKPRQVWASYHPLLHSLTTTHTHAHMRAHVYTGIRLSVP